MARRMLHPASGRAYIMSGLLHPSDRVDGSTVPFFDGVSLDLNVQIAEVRRRGAARLRERGEKARWRVKGGLEFRDYPSIYEIPVNAMVSFSGLRAIYTPRWDKRTDMHFWGPARAAVTDAERQAFTEREQYRESHRDGIDPLKAVVEAEESKLPKQLKNPPVVYLAADYGLVRRRAGVFTTYEQALALAPEKATILEVPADGHTKDREAKLVRGYFKSGWGYASGYAPSGPGEQR